MTGVFTSIAAARSRFILFSLALLLSLILSVSKPLINFIFIVTFRADVRESGCRFINVVIELIYFLRLSDENILCIIVVIMKIDSAFKNAS